ncbi:MAG: DUF448 domain-containing protein [Leptotrichiaceae bacterium]
MPERMCLCCRKKGSKEDFFRISTIKEKCVLDIEHRIQARGIYVCKDKQCVEKLSKHKKIKVDIEILLKMLSILDKSEKSIEKILIGMRNSEYFIYGVDDNIEGVKRDKVKLIILPKDVKEKYKEEFLNLREKYKFKIIYIETQEQLTDIFSRNVNVIGVFDKSVVRGILKKIGGDE